MRELRWSTKAWNDFIKWSESDRRAYKRIIALIKVISRTPFEGIGKPEPLKGDLSGYLSRRIDKEHRLVYQVTDEEIRIASCKYHYKK